MVKNVVVVNDFDYVQGGASKVAIQTANLLSTNKELNVYFFSGCSNNSNELNSNVVNICTNQGEALKDKNKIHGCINGIYNFKAKNELKKLLLKLDKDNTIIHVHGWTKCLSSSIFDIAFKMNYKVVLTLHDYFTACPNGGYFNYPKNEICKYKPLSWKCIKCNCDSRNYAFKLYRIIRQFVQNKIVKLNDRLTNVIAISDFSERILKQTLNNKINIHRVNNPIAFDNTVKKIDYKENEYFIYVGRVSKEKGVDIFCKVISELNFKGIVVGDGPELNYLKQKYINIEFVGWKNKEEVKKYIEGAKALIFPSKLYETMGLTVIESLYLGIPAIVSKNSAASEYVNSNNLFSNEEELKSILKNDNYQLDNANNSFNYKEYMKNIYKLYDKI